MLEIQSIQTRTLTLEREVATDDDNEMTFSFSSEFPVDRGWGREILRHDEGCADFSRMSTAPFLWNHDRNAVLGKVKRAWISGKKGHCTIRWSNKKEAQEYKREVDDGILTNISFAYNIDEIKESPAFGQKTPDYQVVRWTPLEISLVSVPADPSVGIGRSGDQLYECRMVVIDEKKNGDMEENLENIRSEAITQERERIATINALGNRHGFSDLANDLIGKGASIERAREEFLNKIASNPQPVAQPVNPLGLTDKEQRSYSIVKAINAAINNDWSKAGFEKECSLEIAKRSGKEAKGFFVPVRDLNVQQRATYAVGASATGGATVQTDLLAQNFIELLRNKTTVVGLGATMMDGLQDNIAIPRQSSAASTYWIAENGVITQSEATFDQVTMSPKTIAARSQFSRLMLLQSSIDVEQFIRADFAQVIAIGVDLAAIAGTGTGNQPLGILNTPGIGSISLGTNGGAPTYASLINLKREIQIDNADTQRMAWLTNPMVQAKLMNTPKQASGVEGNFILQDPGNSLLGYSLNVTNQVPSNLTKGSGTNLSAIVLGSWDQLMIGSWGTLEILPNPYGAGFNSGAVDIRVMYTCDIAVRRPEFFAVISDIITV